MELIIIELADVDVVEAFVKACYDLAHALAQ